MTIIMCYAPAEVAGDDLEDTFYRKLTDLLHSISTHDTVMVIEPYDL